MSQNTGFHYSHRLSIGDGITLSGSVRSWDERAEAGTAAWNAPGVNTVQNDIAVVGV